MKRGFSLALVVAGAGVVLLGALASCGGAGGAPRPRAAFEQMRDVDVDVDVEGGVAPPRLGPRPGQGPRALVPALHPGVVSRASK